MNLTAQRSLAEVQTEIRERQVRIAKAKLNLVDFSEYVAGPWYQAARHHRYVAEKLHQVKRYIETEGAEGIGRLMIFEPPRHGKSEQVSRLFPAWVLGNLPHVSVMLASYGADLAYEDSGFVRDYVRSDRFQDIFGEHSPVLDEDDPPVRLKVDSQAKSSWHLEGYRGRFTAAGIGGGLVGKGAHLGIIDDPFKSRDDASSEAYRRKVMSWYRSVFRTRLERGGAIVITHTRWDREDLAGTLLKEMVSSALAEEFEVIFLPAIALEEEEYPQSQEGYLENLLRGVYVPMGGDQLGRQAGEVLWPEKYNRADLEKVRYAIQDEFLPQYQQMPEAAGGAVFYDDLFRECEDREVPAGLQWYGYVDLALGKTEQADYNAVLPVAFDENTGRIYYRDMLRVRDLESFMVELKAKMLSPREAGTVWRFEEVAFSSLVTRQFLTDRELAHLDIGGTGVDGDKMRRARALQTRAKQGLVYLVRGYWLQDFKRELAGFPGGKHDDQVDTASGGLELIGTDSWCMAGAAEEAGEDGEE